LTENRITAIHIKLRYFIGLILITHIRIPNINIYDANIFVSINICGFKSGTNPKENSESTIIKWLGATKITNPYRK
jgi:hypothetical protein